MATSARRPSTTTPYSLVINYNGDFEGGVQILGKRVLVGDQGIDDPKPHADYRLAVDGKIVAKEIVVTDGAEWADDVFEDGYELRDLREVEDFIARHGHLPEVPAAEEVYEQGVDLARMDAILLRKVEELTLYILAMEKENRRLAAEVDALRPRIDNAGQR